MFSVYDYGAFQVHGGGGHEGGIVELLNDILVFIDSLSGHSTSEIFALLLPGIAGMANFHPLAVHFPIALLTLFFLVEVGARVFNQENWRKLASGLLYLGAFSAAITVYLGFRAAETVAHDDVTHMIMERHEGYGVAILCLAVLLSIWRSIAARYRNETGGIFLILSGVLTILIVLGADLGGLMVYRHGVSVHAAAPGAEAPMAEPAHEHQHVHGEHSH